ncbi:DNA topoisomerase IV subunit A [Accumulibacter sp.]|uniref:DNA topoisomerase IV subunit A n=1 Tax=Accumulibacter sp. TaxID=2053492 RepID=UPI0025FCDAFE|nr:DNA topoisomerase IV subunit A [Accumulibacter sp.]MCM8596074.1 DNA topoisomerase IV subunit A [Accumulibacter sp.]MCM8627025.1 DNA topoisomerase IV subunit A [Accumulibacter sp.]MDS4050223.1 DNA topoisomerase IV subunit A [Accumulibacter sp.]
MNKDSTPDLFSGLLEEAGGGPPGPPGPPPPPVESGDDDSILLHDSAARDYLEYAVAVVKGRALPEVKDGLKPVQRRVLFAMRELGLSATARPVKSARVVGDVIGKFHPHGDASAYDAMVRVAQPFVLRYPLVDGQGNFGSRDGDNAAAMRYTEARLTPIAELLLGELGEGTVDFQSNYDGSLEEPAFLPARLPFVLLNGASGIAVGMATEIPSHNLREVAAAVIHKIEHPAAGVDELLEHLPGPDFPGGGQIISPSADIAAAYASGRGSLRVRARYEIEELARGAWQLVFTELPPGVSTARVLAEVGALLNPQPRPGRKTIEQSAAQLKALFASQLDRARDESGKDDDVRLVFEPASSRIDRGEFIGLLLAHTSLETSAPINLVAVGIDGRPCQKSLADLIGEWCSFRIRIVERRTRHRLNKAEERIHILEGRLIVLLNIDEVIRLIRESDDPKAALIARFALSDRQAEDILEIRLRQLARLEGIRIEQELGRLHAEREGLVRLLGSNALLRRQVIREIRADADKYGDPRRTLIQAAATASRSEVATVADEPVTVIISAKGWARVRQGHGLDLSGVVYKEGDRAGSAQECRSVDSLIVVSSEGRAFTVAIAGLPDGRGMGAPLSSFVDLAGGRIAHVLTGRPEDEILVAKTSGYGFICRFADLLSRQKAGKAFLSVEEGATILPPLRVAGRDHLAALSEDGRLLVFPLDQMKRLSAGKGVQIIGLREGEALRSVCAISGTRVAVRGMLRNRTKTLVSDDRHLGQRARRGAPIGPLVHATLEASAG